MHLPLLLVGLNDLSGASTRLRSSRAGPASADSPGEEIVSLMLALVEELRFGLEELRDSLADEELALLPELHDRARAVCCLALRARGEIDCDHPAADTALDVARLGSELASSLQQAAIRH